MLARVAALLRPLDFAARDKVDQIWRENEEGIVRLVCVHPDEPTLKADSAVTIREGPFQNYEGTVESTVPDKGIVRVLVTIFGRQVPVDVEYWQVGKAGS